LKTCRWILCFSFCVIIIACVFNNPIPLAHDKQKRQKETVVLEGPYKYKSLNCVKLPYFKGENESIELLSFILHGENNAKLIKDQSGRMQIIYKPSIWQGEYLLQIMLDNNAQLMQICSEKSSDWFSSSKHFILAIQKKYLNVAKKG